MKRKKSRAVRASPRWRIHAGDAIALGPGKVELLDRVNAGGSLQEAAREMGMSYMRAWLLVKTMNGCFRKPLITLTRGGTRGGGAALTPTGQTVLQLYQDLERESLTATGPIQRRIARLLKA